MKADIVATPRKFGMPAAMKPKRLDMPRLTLNAGFLPMKSAVMGMIVAPITIPVYFATVRTVLCQCQFRIHNSCGTIQAIRSTLNSLWTNGLMMVTACIQN